MKTPINDAIRAYTAGFPVRFHTPGHQGIFSEGPFAGSSYDITELSFSDNLLFSSGIIAESERQAAEAYKSAGTLYFTNGATAAVLTAVSAVKALRPDKGFLLISGNCHKSVYSAAELNGFELLFIDAPSDRDGWPLPPDAESVEAALDRAKKDKAIGGIAAAVIVSPDYFGVCADIEAINRVLKANKIALIVDRAHGAHFEFSKLLPKSAVGFAAYVVDGCHKTMPVLTGGAMLHCGNEELLRAAKLKRAQFHSTSPNYAVLASLEYAVSKLFLKGESLYAELEERVNKLKKSLSEAPFTPEGNHDFSRLILKSEGYTGQEFKAELEKNRIWPEMSFGQRVVFILSPYNLGALDILEEVLKKLPEKPKKKIGEASAVKKNARQESLKKELFKGRVTPAALEFVPLKDVAGRISASEVGIYPPGVPLIFKGQIFTEELIASLARRIESVFGLIDGTAAVFRACGETEKNGG